MRVLDLFSAAAGGWSLGLHRAGFTTVAACENVPWRRALYAENNPGVLIYDDVQTLTAERLVADLGTLPDIIVGSPPCQDISGANTKGKGVDGARSGLFFEAVRLIGECRPRWFALENSANLRTRGADRVLSALEALGYACEPCVVGADNVGANHERKRSWLIGFDPEQLARDASGDGWGPGREGRRAQSTAGLSQPTCGHAPDADGDGRSERRDWGRVRSDLPAENDPEHPASLRREGGRPRRHGADGDGAAPAAPSVGDAAHADQAGQAGQAGQADGRMVASLRQAQIALDGRGDGWRDEGDDGPHAHDQGKSDGALNAEVGRSPRAGDDAPGPWSEWNGGLAGHLRVDDGLSAWVAGQRIAVGGPKGTAAASLLVEAFGDAVVPQITEAIGRAILRTEAALQALTGTTT